MEENPTILTHKLLLPLIRTPVIKLLQPFDRISSHTLDLAPDGSPERLPYILDRAMELVFMSPRLALVDFPEEKELAEAVMPFIDS